MPPTLVPRGFAYFGRLDQIEGLASRILKRRVEVVPEPAAKSRLRRAADFSYDLYDYRRHPCYISQEAAPPPPRITFAPQGTSVMAPIPATGEAQFRSVAGRYAEVRPR